MAGALSHVSSSGRRHIWSLAMALCSEDAVRAAASALSSHVRDARPHAALHVSPVAARSQSDVAGGIRPRPAAHRLLR